MLFHNKYVKYFTIGLIALLFILLNVGIFVFSRNLTREKLGFMLFDRLRNKEVTKIVPPSPTSSPTPSPTPLPLAPGKQIYSVRSDSKIPGPGISEATFDPLDTKVGEKISVQVKATDPKGIQSLTIIMIEDNGKVPHELSLSSGTKTGGIWSGTWTATSTHNRIYSATIEAINTAKEKRTIELWFR